MSAVAERHPDNDTGIYLHTHTHDWTEIAAHQFPNGEWVPVFRCRVCTDVICTEASVGDSK